MQKEIHILACHVNTIFLINLSMNILFSQCQEYFFHFANLLHKKDRDKFFKGALITYFTVAVQSLSSV